ncbi:BatA domain-containing protein [Caulobacter sp. S45]|uniref:BatA domain-containing protein n=1 Tax=Caulobacter sp. S45 TaxID=1641861 RepID=UPI00131DD56F|nr:BatA domain-containing protein [Caulobacter sp. S45]
MSAALLAPLGLAALSALLLPLLIHLARRDTQRPIDFAALRWLEPRPKPQRRPRLDERALLAARLVLLAVLALVLARPVLWGESGAQAWLAVAPGVDPAAARALAPKGARARWLAPGLPDLGRPAPIGAAPISSLLRELDAGLPRGATLTVAVPAVLQGVDAERPRLSRAVDWRVLPGATPAPAKPAAHAAPPTLVIRSASDFAAGARYLRAAAAAWARSPAASAPDAGPLSEPLPEGVRAIAWLAPGPIPAAVRDRLAQGAVLLLPAEASIDGLGAATPLWRDGQGLSLVEGGGLRRGRWRRFTRPLDSETTPELLQPDFPTRLAALMADPPPPARVEARDHHPLVGARAGAPAARDLTPVLALVAAALFALERWLATRRQRNRTP